MSIARPHSRTFFPELRPQGLSAFFCVVTDRTTPVVYVVVVMYLSHYDIGFQTNELYENFLDFKGKDSILTSDRLSHRYSLLSLTVTRVMTWSWNVHLTSSLPSDVPTIIRPTMFPTASLSFLSPSQATPNLSHASLNANASSTHNVCSARTASLALV